jgi:glycosyltransferase involved in cell wall biosynthesis
MKISATVITHNEAQDVAAALESLSFADEIIVVDSESTDATVDLARRFTDRVYVRPWPGYSQQKNFAAGQARNDWIFSLDADERVSPELLREIEGLVSAEGEPRASAFEMPRLAFYLGRWIRHSGWYPDRKIRLYDRRRARWTGEYVHEALQVDGPVERLKGDLLHFTVNTVSEHHQRLDVYTTLAAREAFAKGRRASAISLLASPVISFARSYFLKLGFLDGWQGLVIAKFASQYAFLKIAKLRELGR